MTAPSDPDGTARRMRAIAAGLTAAGLTAHGEAPVRPYLITENGSTLTAETELPEARLTFKRAIALLGAPALMAAIRA